jgi:outer membrane cobalamin receptor
MTRALWTLAVFRLLLTAQQPAQPEAASAPKTTITVIGEISAEAPANIQSLDSNALQQTAGTNLDDRLREVPGFSLFRRASSLVAHPTTQGVSLRGIGSSGASRTLVMWDGIPVSDPFGGWVYWTQFVPDDTSEVEISRGASTSLFGDRAMSGVIAVFSAQPEPFRLVTDLAVGNRNTHDASLGFSRLRHRFAVSGAGRAFTTEGYYIVPASIRGAVDRMAGVRFATGNLRVDDYTSLGNIFVKTSLLAEDRQNGTLLTHNSTGLGEASLHFEREFSRNSVSLMAFHEREQFHSSFTAVSASRNTERLSYLQTLPAQASGAAAFWRHHESQWDVLAGADVDRVSGSSTDYLRPAVLRSGGGSQLQHGLFAQANGSLGPVRLFAGVRYSFAGQDSRFMSPSAGASFGRRRLHLRSSVYRAFRAPTLNELYREFRVGNTDTLANPNLRPETLFGVEAGVDWIGENSTFRLTGYRNALDSLITNVTIASTPNAIVRQRANAATALSRGLEASFKRRYRDWSAELNYLFVGSRYSTGFRIAQVPKHQGSGSLMYRRGGTLASLGVRSFSYQFDDDLNQFRLPGFGVVELVGRQRLKASLSAELSIENALNRTFYTAFTPTPNIGQPRLWRIGLRWGGRL